MKKHSSRPEPLAPNFEIEFYCNANGRNFIGEWLQELAADNSPQTVKRVNKIAEYFRQLAIRGLQLRSPVIKKITDEIYELRPFSDRIFFAAWTGQKFIVLHHFEKHSQKTPPREIATAQNRWKDYCARKNEEEKQQ